MKPFKRSLASRTAEFKRPVASGRKESVDTSSTACALKTAAAAVQRNADKKDEEQQQKKKKLLEKISSRKAERVKPISREFSTTRKHRSKRGREDQSEELGRLKTSPIVQTSSRFQKVNIGKVPKSPKGARLLGSSVASIAKQLQKDDRIRRQLLMIAKRANLDEEVSSDDDTETEDDRNSVALILSAVDSDEECFEDEDEEVGEDGDVEIFLGLPSSMMTVTSSTRKKTVTPPPCGSTSQGVGNLLLGPCRLKSANPTRCHLILDLDETLVAARGADVIVRPFVLDFLLTARSLDCEILLWTAGVYSHTMRSVAAISQVYGSEDWYDEIIWRNSKWYKDDVYSVKDLKLLGRPLRQCFLIDNSPCVVVQPMNALIVEDYVGEGSESDSTLSLCEIILKEVVRTLNSSFDKELPEYNTHLSDTPSSNEDIDGSKRASVLSPKPSPRLGPRKSPVPLPGRSSGVRKSPAPAEFQTQDPVVSCGVLTRGVGDALMESENIITTPLPITGQFARMRKTHVLAYGPKSRRQYGGVPVDGFQPWSGESHTEKHG